MQKLNKTGQVHYFVASLLIDIMMLDMSICPCTATYKIYYSNSSMPHHQKCKMPDPHGPAQPMTSMFKWQMMLPPTPIKFLQRVIRTFIYYGCAVNSTSIVALIYLYAEQSQGTQGNHGLPHLVPWLHGHVLQCDSQFISVRHDPNQTHWRILPLLDKTT